LAGPVEVLAGPVEVWAEPVEAVVVERGYRDLLLS